MNNKKKSTIILVSLFILLTILSFSLSYAYLTRVNNAETTTTIKADSGIMQIYLEGGARIEVTSFSPSATAFATKNFTVTGNTNTSQTMSYHIILVMESNTFSYDALKYKLISTNTDGNGTIAPSITTMKEIGNGAREKFLGNGTFAGSTSGEKIHSYTLELYFPVTGGDQSHDQSKSFEGHIEIREGTGTANNYLSDAIVTAYGGSSTITAANSSLFNSISASNENSVYKMLDDYGISYYYRGAKDYVNNNIIFAEQQWKIVRINGDGSIRLIYNGTCPDNTCTINTTGTNTIIGTAAFAYDYLDNKRVGYMFSPYGSPANSTSRAQATTNEISQQIKEKVVDPWYNYNLLNTDYEDYISDTLFCNDRQLRSEVGGAATGTGYGQSDTYYAPYQRLDTTKAPNIKCGLKNDRFTVDDTTLGNGALTYPAGLITADEVAIAGLHRTLDNTTNYLYVNNDFWTMSPGFFEGGSTDIAKAFGVTAAGKLVSQLYVTDVRGVRPVINLKANAIVTGAGTTSNPYKVVISATNGLKEAILADYGGAANITEAPAGTFANISVSTDNLMYKMDDDYGTSYYFRGAQSLLRNNIIFAEQQWKIVRINGNGSIRLLYNGTCANNSCTINSTGTATQIGTSTYNTSRNDNKYFGYMYLPSGTTASTSRAQATTNTTSSAIKTNIDSWYSTNLDGTIYASYLSDTLFCNDRQLRSEVGGPATGTGYGSSTTVYAAFYRLDTTKAPNIKCGLKNDCFTVIDSTFGNGALTYPVGLLSADEIAIAGVVYEIDNSTNYLYTGQGYWLLSPAVFNVGSGSYSYQWDVSVEGHLGYSTSQYVLGVRPVINIKSSALFSGSGTIADPYIVEVSE